MSRYIIILITIFFVSCVKDIRIEPPFTPMCGEIRDVSVQDIREAIGEGTLYIDDDILVEVTVIANDYHNNFFKTIVASDETGGFELLIGTYDTHLQFPIGRTFHLSMKGLTVDIDSEVMRVGLSEHTLEVETPSPFEHYYILDKFVCDCTLFLETDRPESRSILELSSDMCGQLVKVTGLLNEKHWLTWASGKREHVYFQDDVGNKIVVETSLYSDFATEATPKGEVAITGVLSLQNIDEELFYTLKMRNLYDISNI